MVNNYPYYNPYGQQFQNYQQQVTPQIPQQQVVKVNGENGARAYAMGANSSALLLDECGTIVWLKTTDGAGFPTVSPYDISPHQVPKTQDFMTLESRVARLEETVNEYATANTSTVARKGNAKPVSQTASAD